MENGETNLGSNPAVSNVLKTFYGFLSRERKGERGSSELKVKSLRFTRKLFFKELE